MSNKDGEVVRFDLSHRIEGLDPSASASARVSVIADDGTVTFENDGLIKDLSLVDDRYHENTLTHTRPFRCVGRLPHYEGTQRWNGSAFAVGPRLIMSAAHNFHGGPGGNQYTGHRFEPGYPVTGRSIPIERVWLPAEWLRRGQSHNDFAFAMTSEVIWPDLWYGVYGNVDDPVGWAIYGYPAKAPFDGEKQFVDMGASTSKPWRNGSLRFSVMACDNYDLGGGVSGGPWIGGSYPRPTKILLPHGGGPDHSGAYAGGLHSGTYRSARDCAGSPQFSIILENFLSTIRPELP